VTRRQLLDAGMTVREIERRLERGELSRLHAGVYLLGGWVTQHTRKAAAVLACGPGTAVSHISAAYLRAFLPYPEREVPTHVTVRSRNSGPRRGAVVHRTRRLEADEIGHRFGIPVTSPARTLIDLASCASRDALERALAETFAVRLTDRARMLAALERAGRKRGTATLRELLDARRAPARLRSPAERGMLELIRAAGLPEPEVNARVGRWEVDFFWPQHGLVVEVDGYGAHSSPTAFERDRIKAAELEDAGSRFAASATGSSAATRAPWLGG